MTEKLSNEYENKIKIVQENYNIISENIHSAAEKAGRDLKDITLLAATKTVPAEIINYALKIGINCIGENRVQEFLSKYDDLNLTGISTHFIGHLQTNKVKQIITKVDMIESVDSVKLAKEISLQSIKNNIKTDVLVEVNIGLEENKSGVYPERLTDLLSEISLMDSINVKGLMAIPPICSDKNKLDEYFSKMHELFIDTARKNMDNICMDYLSMGMSKDYYSAILHGANIVRIGSALFGNRSYS